MHGFQYHIVLIEPQIPPNTGNIGRLCVATQSTLHLVGCLGFSLEEKHLRRAGLDYWKYLKLQQHSTFEQWLSWNKTKAQGPFYLLTKKTKRSIYEENIPPNAAFVFGKETLGLSEELLSKYKDRVFTIPMFSERIRSLNLSNAVSITLYEAIRQQRIRSLKNNDLI